MKFSDIENSWPSQRDNTDYVTNSTLKKGQINENKNRETICTFGRIMVMAKLSLKIIIK